MSEHSNDCPCQTCHSTRHGLWAVVIPVPAPMVLPGFVTRAAA